MLLIIDGSGDPRTSCARYTVGRPTFGVAAAWIHSITFTRAPAMLSPNAAVKTWDMDVEYRYWQGVAERQGCPLAQFAFRWVQMQKIYAIAADRRLPMEEAFQQFLQEIRQVAMAEDVARLVFGWTWARIVSRVH
jgi:hypothetical protein